MFVYNRIALELKAKGIAKVHPEKLRELGIGARIWEKVLQNRAELDLGQAFAVAEWLGVSITQIFYTEKQLNLKINTDAILSKHAYN